MRTVLKIAINELRDLFYSPVAWVTLIVFMVMCGFFYTSSLFILTQSFHYDMLYNPYFYLLANVRVLSLTGQVFPDVFTNILQYLYLYVPLITMGIINKEFNSGTIRLMYSSPVSIRQIVLGKYLGIMFFNLFFVLIMGIFVVEGFADIVSLDYGPLLSAILGIYLLLCALSAIGLFMSALTSYQIVAAIASFTVLYGLRIIGTLWQEYDFWRDFAYFLSINNRIDWLIKGLIRSKDLLYYLVIITLFVVFTILKLSDGVKRRAWHVRVARYLGVIVAGLLIGFVGSRAGITAYLDTSARKVNTIRPETQAIVHAMKDSALEVTMYTNLFDLINSGSIGVVPARRNAFLDAWEQYTRFKPDIKFRYEYYYHMLPGDSGLYRRFPGKTEQQIAGLLAKGLRLDSALFKSPDEINKIIDLKSEGYRSVMQLNYRGRKTFLRVLPAELNEMEYVLNQTYFNAAFKRVLGTKMPKLSYITGELERSLVKKGEREYSGQYHLVNLGFDFDTTNLSTHDLPADISVVILADPKMDLSTVVLSKLRKYLDNGGNMLILGEPKKQYVLNPLLQSLGMQLMPGQLVQVDPNETADKITLYSTPYFFDLANHHFLRELKLLWKNNFYPEDMSVIGMAGSTPVAVISDRGFTAAPLFLTKPFTRASTKNNWLKAGKLVTDSAAPVFNASEGDLRFDSLSTAIKLTRQLNGNEQRIIVSGDADIISNSGLSELSEYFFSWLTYQQFPVYTPIPTPPPDNDIKASLPWATLQKKLYVWILPGIMLVTGTILLVRRKRK